MLNFEEFLNESFLPDHLQDELREMENFENKVISRLKDIIQNAESISEKDFTRYDEMSEKVDKFIIELRNEEEWFDIINKFNDKRPEYCAEYIYDEKYK